jgi:hypothetical protein
MDKNRLDEVRENVLARMERAERARTYAIAGAAVVEAVFLALAIFLTDWSDQRQIVMFLLFVLTYSWIGIGLIALGAHITNNAGRVIAAVQSMAETKV